MNIIYIDLLSPLGHKWFNKMQLQGISEAGSNVHVISSKDTVSYYEGLGYYIPYKIPNFLVRSNNRILVRLYTILLQYLLFIRIDWKAYDAVVFSSYESMTFWLMPVPRIKVFIINHITAQETTIPSKLRFIKLINKRVHHIVFNEYIKNHFIKCGIINTLIVPHGFECLKKQQDNRNRYIFCPSSSSVDKKFISQLIQTPNFLQFLRDNSIKLILKGRFDVNQCDEVNIITYRLSDADYSRLLGGALCILIPYNDSFNYRVSAVMHESIAYNVKCLINYSPNFVHYSSLFKYNPFFEKTSDGLMKGISMILNSDKDDNYQHLEGLMPVNYWKKILTIN